MKIMTSTSRNVNKITRKENDIKDDNDLEKYWKTTITPENDNKL